MRKMSGLILALAALGVFGMWGVAQATTFTVSDIGFSNFVGNTDGDFQWTLNKVLTPPSVTLSAGNWGTFTYGSLTTYDFPIDKHVKQDDKNDSFKASFTVTPPGAPSDSQTASVEPTWVNKQDGSVLVDFSGALIDVHFGYNNSGEYKVEFLDSTLTQDGSVDLAAKISYITADSNPPDLPVGGGDGGSPVPEPGTLLLLGSGLAGLPFWRKKA